MKKSIITIVAVLTAIVAMSMNVFAQDNSTANASSNWTVQVERPLAINMPNNTVFLGTIAPGTNRNITGAEINLASHVFEISGAAGAEYSISGASTTDMTSNGVTISGLQWSESTNGNNWNTLGSPSGTAINNETGVFGSNGLYSTWVNTAGNGINVFQNTINNNLPVSYYRVYPTNISADATAATGLVTFTVNLTATYTNM